ncbi:MAG TPA: FHA domain-containing protein [Thermoanaerobaculia bacterium]|jgi:hypothetical protein|nr:FHA domain-containing protein [Thermoanaerobaculia bacterium]
MAFLLRSPEGLTNRVEGPRLRIGRGTDADLRFDDAGVSLAHAEIVQEGGVWRIADLGSVTGTYLSGKDVKAIGDWRLADGDTIDLGSVRLKVHLAAGIDELEIEILPQQPAGAATAEAKARPQTAALAAPALDYVAAYRLRRGLLSKSWLALLLTLAAAVAALLLPIRGWLWAFRPGPVARAHAELACADCHAPWRGPADAQCAACHGAKMTNPAPPHHLDRLADPNHATPCSACHSEHRGAARLTTVTDRDCVACHGDLAAHVTLRSATSAAGKEPVAVARRIHSFATDHADFAPLAGIDPTRVKLNHQLHLKARLQGLPPGHERLVCADCHRGVEQGREPEVSYAAACASCHPLTFDPRLATERAPHATPVEVHRFLLVTYAESPAAARNLFVDRRRILRGEGTREVNLSPRVRKAANDAEIYLFRTACAECHGVDLSTTPPRIEPSAIPPRWLPRARFRHADHAQVARCVDCHEKALDSRKSSDVLLPGIATCRPCHGGTKPSGAVVARPAATECAACHEYHPRQPTEKRISR